MNKKERNKLNKEAGNMPLAGTAKKRLGFKAKLDKISAKANTLTGKDRMIELDPQNPYHKVWYEEDQYKGK